MAAREPRRKMAAAPPPSNSFSPGGDDHMADVDPRANDAGTATADDLRRAEGDHHLQRRHRCWRADSRADDGDLLTVVVDDADSVVAVFEGDVVDRLAAVGSLPHDIAEPAHDG